MKMIIAIVLVILNSVLLAQDHTTCDFLILDESINPGDDFYRYSSGKWLENNSIPPNKQRFGYFNIAQKKIENQLNDMMKKCIEKDVTDMNHIENMVGVFYQTGLDTIRIKKMKFGLVDKQMNQIEKISNLEDFTEVLFDFQLSGINPLYKIHN
jgi:putative endopeptidase